MAYSFSRTWKAPQVKEKEAWDRVLKAREHICPDSPFFTKDLNRKEHEIEMKREKEEWLKAKKDRAEKEAAQGLTIRILPFGGKKFENNLSPVLGQPTIWCPSWQVGKEATAPWPSLSEMKYEGDERIATAKHHGRFLPVPRLPGNETVNWQHLSFLEPLPFDRVRHVPDEVDIMMNTHTIPELEITDEEGMSLLGKDLMEALDPKGVYG
ncbi:hypothetical protein M8818_001477 [Zalaria obscura]|uniref:Uncharacterized protein n=1 Tax=Zalaria obscura TaxID=2024903 RepID=A0ACC3SKD9_9PEZI